MCWINAKLSAIAGWSVSISHCEGQQSCIYPPLSHFPLVSSGKQVEGKDLKRKAPIVRHIRKASANLRGNHFFEACRSVSFYVKTSPLRSTEYWHTLKRGGKKGKKEKSDLLTRKARQIIWPPGPCCPSDGRSVCGAVWYLKLWKKTEGKKRKKTREMANYQLSLTIGKKQTYVAVNVLNRQQWYCGSC